MGVNGREPVDPAGETGRARKSVSNVAAVVLAAGGAPESPDALRMVDGGTALAIVLRTLAAVPLQDVIVVLGPHAGALRGRVDLGGAVGVESGGAGAPMIASVVAGLERADGESTGALVWPVDRPLVSIVTVRALLASHAAGALIALPVCDVPGDDLGRRGHPVLFARALFDELGAAAARADFEGAASVVHARDADVVEVPVLDRGILADIGAPSTRELMRRARAEARAASEDRPAPGGERRRRGRPPRRGRS